MHFTDSAFILSARRHGEHAGIVRALCKQHGMIAGAAPGMAGKRARGIWQPGNLALVTWRARTSAQLGTLSGELIAPYAAWAMADAAMLTMLSSACTLVEAALPEGEAHPQLYDALHCLLEHLQTLEAWEQYSRFEWTLLSECGYRLDLSACAATGATEDLMYVSPRSGRAVSRAAGEPYKEKLLKLPGFLHLHGRNAPPEIAEILDSLALTGYFLQHWLFAPHGRNLPAARNRLMEMLNSIYPMQV